MKSFALATLMFLTGTAGFAADKLQVVTDILPVQSLVQIVAGDLAEVTVLMGQDADPHHFQMRPSQVRALGQADAVVFIGDALTPWLAEKAGGLAPDATLLALMAVEGSHVHTDEHGADPHAWLDIDNAILWVGSLAETLGLRDPANAEQYLANAGEARAVLLEVEAEVRALSGKVGGSHVVMAHDAFGYLTEALGIEVEGSVTDSHAHAPGAAHIAELEHALEDHPADCMLTEAGEPDEHAERLAEEHGIPVAVLDPLGVTAEPGPGLYVAMMRANLSALADCLAD